MRIHPKRFVSATAAFAAVATGLLVSGGAAQAAPPGTPPEGPAVLSPLTGDSSSSFTLIPDPNPATPGNEAAFCPGTGAAGHRWTTFLVPTSVDPATVIHGPDGPVLPGGSTDFYSPLFAGGAPIVQQNPATTPAGLIPGIPTFDFTAYDTSYRPPAGSYFIGVACEFSGETTKYWSNTITITNSPGAGAAEFTYAQGLPTAAPTAPTLNTVTPGSGTLTAAFSAVTANPVVTGYTVTATDGTNTFTATGASSPLTVTGLTNGTAYDVTVTATNATGTSPASNVVSGTPTAGAQPAPTNLTAVPGANAGEIDLSWTAPAGVAPNGYTLTVTGTPADPSSPYTVPAGTSFTVTGLPAGVVYDFSLLPTYADPSAVGTAAVVSAAASGAQTLQQEIVVERPAGALILTQRCGVNNALAAEPVDAGFPGFPAVDAIAATADQVGTSPDIDLATPGVQVDPEFGDYPFAVPATYPTRCIVDLGTAELLTTGDLAGQYYAADGALNEVTVVDTRDGDNGWTVTGSIPSLSNGGANPDDSFTGDLVGWTPVVSSTSDPVGGSTYDQVVTPGAPVVPGTTGGLAAPAGQVLADANAGAGLGVAVLDARVKVLIPVANATGEYSGVLTLNAS